MKKIVFKKILDLIPQNSRVLDLGCGNGELLAQLRKNKSVQGYGVEIDLTKIIDCINRDISVFHGNIDEGLKEFSDSSYDYVILSQTLQQVKKPLFVISEMLRVGKKVIVTFPNFGFWKIRTQLLIQGIAPISKELPYSWYNTPNIRVLTIKDFINLCKQENINIAREIPIYKTKLTEILFSKKLSNLLSQRGMFIIESDK
jgi:methionine biosynthesis protein MetW